MLLVVRHADAGDKRTWTGPDSLRPLSPSGLLQAEGLVVRLEDYPIERILCSPTLRCYQTAEPLARDRLLRIETVPELGVGATPAQLLALFSQTAKNSKNLADLVTKYEARVLALANAHRLITEGGWKSTSLSELLNTLLAAFLDRISFSGPNVFLEPDPTFGLSMAVHELATNASKHGSLSVPSGRVDLSWSVARTQQGLTLILDWKEGRGPAPRRSRRAGFGSRLINMVIERQLNGQVEQSFAADGLHARLTVPLTHERWLGGARSSSANASP